MDLYTGLKAKIIAVETGTIAGAPNLKTLYIKYLSTSTLHDHFSSSETLTVYSETLDNWQQGKTFVVNSATGTWNNNYYGSTSRISIDPGVIYARGAFIKTDKISTLVGRYNPLAKYNWFCCSRNSIFFSNRLNTFRSSTRFI